MKRREFTRGLLALGVAPNVALSSLAQGAAASAAPVASANFTPFMYSWSVTHARGLGQCSPEILMGKLGLGPDAAQAITSRMIKNGVITAPNAVGISQAIQPEPVPVKSTPGNPVQTQTPDASSKPMEKLRDLQDKLASDAEDPDVETLVEEPSLPEVDTVSPVEDEEINNT